MIEPLDALRTIEKRRRDSVAITTMMGSRTWSHVSQKQSLDWAMGFTMGKASSVALGICLAQPDKKVIMIDGDGSLLMNLGTLVSIGEQAPNNFYHFVMDNGVYAVTGGQPVPNADGFSFAGLAKSSGYTAVYKFDDREDFANHIDAVLSTKGPVLVTLKTNPSLEHPPDYKQPGLLRNRAKSARELKQALGK